MFVVVGEAVASASTPLDVIIEMDVPAISCEALVGLVLSLPVVLTLVSVVALMAGGSDVESATVLNIWSSVETDAVA